jgi:hypothetical protein
MHAYSVPHESLTLAAKSGMSGRNLTILPKRIPLVLLLAVWKTSACQMAGVYFHGAGI